MRFLPGKRNGKKRFLETREQSPEIFPSNISRGTCSQSNKKKETVGSMILHRVRIENDRAFTTHEGFGWRIRAWSSSVEG